MRTFADGFLGWLNLSAVRSPGIILVAEVAFGP